MEVTQNGGGPMALVAIHPAGNAGGIRLSKFVKKTVLLGQGVTITVAVGVGLGVGLAVGTSQKRPLTLKTICMFGNPSAAVVVGLVTPHAGALM